MKTVGKTDDLEVVTGAHRYNSERLLTHQRRMMDQRAAFAAEMIRSWGVVAARPADQGEMRDERGLTLLPPQELVERACAITEAAFAAFGQRGWLVNLPAYADLAADDAN